MNEEREGGASPAPRPWPPTHHGRREQGLAVQEDAGGRHLLQPLAAGVPAALLVFAVVVVAVAQGRQQLLGEGAHSSHQRLAEDAVPPQLQLRVCGRRGPCRAISRLAPRSPELAPTPQARPPIWAQLAKILSIPWHQKPTPLKTDSPKASRSVAKLNSLNDPSAYLKK